MNCSFQTLWIVFGVTLVHLFAISALTPVKSDWSYPSLPPTPPSDSLEIDDPAEPSHEASEASEAKSEDSRVPDPVDLPAQRARPTITDAPALPRPVPAIR